MKVFCLVKTEKNQINLRRRKWMKKKRLKNSLWIRLKKQQTKYREGNNERKRKREVKGIGFVEKGKTKEAFEKKILEEERIRSYCSRNKKKPKKK